MGFAFPNDAFGGAVDGAFWPGVGLETRSKSEPGVFEMPAKGFEGAGVFEPPFVFETRSKSEPEVCGVLAKGFDGAAVVELSCALVVAAEGVNGEGLEGCCAGDSLD